MKFDADRPKDAIDVPGASAARPDDQRRDEAAEPARRRRKPNLERAHKSVSHAEEAVPGAPRSGSA